MIRVPLSVSCSEQGYEMSTALSFHVSSKAGERRSATGCCRGVPIV